MFCTKCGKELKDGAAFCVHCGASVKNGVNNKPMELETVPDIQSGNTMPDSVPNSLEKPKKSKLIPIILVIAGVLAVAAISFGVIYFFQNREDDMVHNDSANVAASDMILGEDADSNQDSGEEPKEMLQDMEKQPEEAEGQQETQPENKTEGPKQPGTVVVGSSSDDAESSSAGGISSDQEFRDEDNSDAEDAYVVPGSDTQYITMADLKGLSAEECRIARNEIYARHGRKFDDEGLQAYFNGKEWYHGTIDPDDFREDMLNEYELANRDLIVEFEKKSGYR